MKCNICGAEFDREESVCKYCGNELVSQREEEVNPTCFNGTRNNPTEAVVSETGQSPVFAERRVRVQQKDRTRFCTKCGRPLDGATNKCVVCEAADVVRETYRRNITRENMEESDMAGSRKKKSRKKKKNTSVKVLMLIVVLVVLLITMIMVGSKWMTKLLNENKQNTQSSATSAKITATEKPTEKVDIETEVPTEKTTVRPTSKPTEASTPAPPKVTEPPMDELQDKHDEVLKYHGGEYLYPTYKQIITDDELDGYTRQEIKIILQEIYAYYGYMFEDDDLIEHFESQPWYTPKTSDLKSVESKLNKFEKENVEIIEEYQRKKGWRI